MKFYIDFEATQFSQRIIAIGCVAENGSTFQSYVKLANGDKLTKFITALTGITSEDLKSAPCADEVFNNLMTWIKSFNSTQNTFYCYGNSDATFIKNTIKKMTDFDSIMIASYIRDNLVDYSKIVTQFFDVESLGLYRIYAFTHEEMTEQKHDPLEDAQMLKYVEENLQEKYNIGDVKKMPKNKHLKKTDYKEDNPLPQYYLNWNNQTKEDSQVSGSKDNYVISGTFSKNKKTIIKYFTSIEEGAYWAFKYGNIRNKSPKNKNHLNEVINRINKKSDANKNAYGVQWEKKSTE